MNVNATIDIDISKAHAVFKKNPPNTINGMMNGTTNAIAASGVGVIIASIDPLKK